MFNQLNNIDTAFKHVRLFSFVLIMACLTLSCYALYKSYALVQQMRNQVYVLAGGKVLEALGGPRAANMAAEAKDHIRMFHQYFFQLDPDEAVIENRIGKALYLSGASAMNRYHNLKESGYYRDLVSGNISVALQMDSIQVKMNHAPYYFRYYGTETLTRATTIVTRSLITEGYLRTTARSDHNPHGFLIEKWHIRENKDLEVKKRTFSPAF